jgi:hypothetical protein
MSHRRSPQKNRNAEADDRSSLENPIYTNVTAAPTHNLSGLDSVGPQEYSRAGTPGVTEASTGKVATPNYSKRPSGLWKYKFSHLCEFC